MERSWGLQWTVTANFASHSNESVLAISLSTHRFLIYKVTELKGEEVNVIENSLLKFPIRRGHVPQREVPGFGQVAEATARWTLGPQPLLGVSMAKARWGIVNSLGLAAWTIPVGFSP